MAASTSSCWTAATTAPQRGSRTGRRNRSSGKRQSEWLREALLASRAPFKVLACGSGWSIEDGPTGDTWAAFLTERNALFDFIRDNRIEGVV